MNQEIEDKILEKLPELRSREHVLHWSAGADSIACHLRMREWGIEPTLVYMYYIDGLPLVENYISYYENKTGCHINRLPNTLFWDDYENGLYQLPTAGNKLYKEIARFGWGRYDKKSYNETLQSAYPDAMSALGLRVTDGINRASMLRRNGPVQGNKWYPVAPCGFNDIKDILRKYDMKLPLDYALWGLSFESPRWWMMPALKKECPETYRMILEYFPLAKLMTAQAEAINKPMPGGAMRRKKIYEGFAMDKGALIW